MSKKVKIAIAILFVILITYVVYSVINYKNTHVTQEDINRGIMEKGQLLLNGAGIFY
ncbi:MAG: hypothetical protein K6D97_03180 [Clostridia bacterium]|nr:hypothetical protein [Clostridia bacterium]